MVKNLGTERTNSMMLLSDIAMEKLSSQLDKLYLVGARNFLLIDVPPVERTPAGTGNFLIVTTMWTYQSFDI